MGEGRWADGECTSYADSVAFKLRDCRFRNPDNGNGSQIPKEDTESIE